MPDSHVISALRAKRAEISGHIHDLEKRIARQRANLANVDAMIKLLSPGANPDAIPPKRAYRRTRSVPSRSPVLSELIWLASGDEFASGKVPSLFLPRRVPKALSRSCPAGFLAPKTSRSAPPLT
jgi:hypothetical protein